MLICNVRRASGIGKGPGLFIVVSQAQQFSADVRSLLALGGCGGAINQTADQFTMPPGFLLSQHSVSLALKGLQTPRAERQIRRLCGTFEIFFVAFGAANLQSRVRHTAQHARKTCAPQQTKCNCNLRDCTCTASNYWQTSRRAVVETAGNQNCIHTLRERSTRLRGVFSFSRIGQDGRATQTRNAAIRWLWLWRFLCAGHRMARQSPHMALRGLRPRLLLRTSRAESSVQPMPE